MLIKTRAGGHFKSFPPPSSLQENVISSFPVMLKIFTMFYAISVPNFMLLSQSARFAAKMTLIHWAIRSVKFLPFSVRVDAFASITDEFENFSKLARDCLKKRFECYSGSPTHCCKWNIQGIFASIGLHIYCPMKSFDWLWSFTTNSEVPLLGLPKFIY